MQCELLCDGRADQFVEGLTVVPKLFNAATFEESLLQNNEYSFFVQRFSSVMWCRQIFCRINNYGDNSQTCMSHLKTAILPIAHPLPPELLVCYTVGYSEH